MQVKKVSEQYIEMAVGTVKIYTFPMYVKDLVKISYVAVRGRDEEEGQFRECLIEKEYLLSNSIF